MSGGKQCTNILDKIIKPFDFLTEIVGMTLLVMMTLIVCFTVVTRYFFSYTPGWGESGALLCMVWFGFLSMALGVRDDQHLAITILDHLVSQKTLQKLDYFKQISVCLFALFMIQQGYALAQIGALNNLPGLDVPSSVLYAAVPISGIMMGAYALANIMHNLQGKNGGL